MIRKAALSDAAIVTALSLKLWPDNTYEEMLPEFMELLRDSECSMFLAFEEEQPIGFAQCQLRHD